MPVTTPHIQNSWRPRHTVDELVPRHDRRLRRVARSYGHSGWDVDDVVQTTWVAYLEHGHSLREPAALGAWLETTARRLSLRVLQRHVREQLTDSGEPNVAGSGAEPEPELLAGERREVLFAAL